MCAEHRSGVAEVTTKGELGVCELPKQGSDKKAQAENVPNSFLDSETSQGQVKLEIRTR